MLLNRHFFFVAKASALTEDLGQDEERRNRCPCDKVERQLYFCPFGCQSDHQCDRVPHQLCHGDGNGDSREPTSIIRYERVTCRQGCEDLAQFKTDKDDRSDHHDGAEQAGAVAEATLRDVYQRVGFVAPSRTS